MLGRELILAAALLVTSLACHAGDVAWRDLSPREQAALAPLAGDWHHFPAEQKAKLRKVAQGYAKLAPPQQQLLQARLRAWSHMTPEQRRIARDNYRSIQALPKHDQIQLKQQWLDSLCQEFGQDSPHPPPQPASPQPPGSAQ